MALDDAVLIALVEAVPVEINCEAANRLARDRPYAMAARLIPPASVNSQLLLPLPPLPVALGRYTLVRTPLRKPGMGSTWLAFVKR